MDIAQESYVDSEGRLTERGAHVFDTLHDHQQRYEWLTWEPITIAVAVWLIVVLFTLAGVEIFLPTERYYQSCGIIMLFCTLLIISTLIFLYVVMLNPRRAQQAEQIRRVLRDHPKFLGELSRSKDLLERQLRTVFELARRRR